MQIIMTQERLQKWNCVDSTWHGDEKPEKQKSATSGNVGINEIKNITVCFMVFIL